MEAQLALALITKGPGTDQEGVILGVDTFPREEANEFSMH